METIIPYVLKIKYSNLFLQGIKKLTYEKEKEREI